MAVWTIQACNGVGENLNSLKLVQFFLSLLHCSRFDVITAKTDGKLPRGETLVFRVKGPPKSKLYVLLLFKTCKIKENTYKILNSYHEHSLSWRTPKYSKWPFLHKFLNFIPCFLKTNLFVTEPTVLHSTFGSDVCTGQIYWSCHIRELMNWIVQLSYGNMTVVGTSIKYSALCDQNICAL